MHGSHQNKIRVVLTESVSIYIDGNIEIMTPSKMKIKIFYLVITTVYFFKNDFNLTSLAFCNNNSYIYAHDKNAPSTEHTDLKAL